MKSENSKYTIYCQVEKWEISYSLLNNMLSDCDLDSYSLNVTCTVNASNLASIRPGSTLSFCFQINDVLLNNKSKFSGLFLKHYKKWDCHMTVPSDFINRFEFLINQNILPYFDILCEDTEDKKGMSVTGFIMHNMESRRN